MRQRRSRIELCVDVLRAVEKGRFSPSRICCAANLSYDRVMKYIEFLCEQEMVNKAVGKKNGYVITEKGLSFIRYFKKVENVLVAMV